MSADELTTFRNILTSNQCRITAAREATFKLLLRSEPQTVKDILKHAEGIVDRVSVYRNLDLFEKLGIVHRINVGWKYKLELSGEFIAHHHHLSCLGCGKIIDIEDEKHIDEFIKSVAAKAGFTPRRHQFEVDGYCNACTHQAKVTPPPL